MQYKITFLSYWAVGSGKGGGLGADAVVLKENGLTIIPGKTLKGLWREAYRESRQSSLIELFGHEKKMNDDDKGKDKNATGSLKFGSARLPETLRKALESNKEVASELYHTRTSTKVDSDKQAVNHSLRKMEVCVPLTLEAEIEGVPDDKVKELENLMAGIRFLGEKRYRGLGRCKIEKIN
jgi:hypothetical protein